MDPGRNVGTHEKVLFLFELYHSLNASTNFSKNFGTEVRENPSAGRRCVPEGGQTSNYFANAPTYRLKIWPYES